MMEIGNMVFGHSRGEYEFPDRGIVSHPSWQLLCELTNTDGYGFTYEKGFENSRGGYEDEVISIKPYWWGDVETEEEIAEAEAPNFLYKPTGFEIRWYKYPFRDSYMNQPMKYSDIINIFYDCVDHLIQKMQTKMEV